MPDSVKRVLTVGSTALVIMLIGLIIIKILISIEKKALKRTKVDPSLYPFITTSTKIVLLISLIIMVLQQIGVSTSSLITVLGAGAAAVALAVRDSLANLAGGLMIIVTKPFKCGDEIRITGDVEADGIVDAIELLTTRLHTYDRKHVIIPNGKLTTSVIMNHTAAGKRRINTLYRLPYDTDYRKVKAILETIISGDPIFLNEPEVVIGICDHDSGTYTVQLFCWTLKDDYFSGIYRLNERVREEFLKEKIEEVPLRSDINIQNQEDSRIKFNER
jgi:small conductance mechanosensitive channel